MVKQTSAAGPFELQPDSDIPSGGSVILNTREAQAGPRNKKGGLKKFYGSRGGFDYVQVVNATDEVVVVEANGGAGQRVPPATTATIEGSSPEGADLSRATVMTFVKITNTGVITSASIDSDRITAAFGNNNRPEEGQSATFNPLTAIPGFET